MWRLFKGKKLNWRFNVNFGRNTSEVTLANDDIIQRFGVINKMLEGNLAIEGREVGVNVLFPLWGII